MREEKITCDVCHEPIIISGDGNIVALRDVCAMVTLSASLDHLELRAGHVPNRASDNTVIVDLHICFKCADKNMSGWGPIERFSGTSKGAIEKVLDERGTPADPEPKLQNVRRYVDVVVRTAAGDEIVLPPAEPARNSQNVRADLVEWPVGSLVWVRSLEPHADVTVIGYAVKQKNSMSWDTPTPQCEKCGRYTEHGERVTLHDAGPSAYEPWCAKCSGPSEDATSTPRALPPAP